MPKKRPTVQIPAPPTTLKGTVITEWKEQPDHQEPAMPSFEPVSPRSHG